VKTEIEAKFLHINHDEIRQALTLCGAVCEHSMRLMQRAIFEDKHGELRKKGGYIRVRDEGDKVTVTYKQFDALSIDGAKEIETVVESFDGMINILKAANLELQSLQESKRETWKLDDVEIVLDEWPWLDTYIEIEADSEEKIKATAKKLQLEWSDAVFGDVTVAYRAQYPRLQQEWGIGSLAQVRFGDSLPEMLKSE
jgi:adenylate cyclase class 2